MSTKIACNKNVVKCLTSKFETEVKKFFVWAVEKEYIINDIEDEEIEWSLELLDTINFNEPSRNKLEGFIKAVIDTYKILRNRMRIDDPKLVAKDFKETPAVKSPRKNAKKEKIDSEEKKVKKIKENENENEKPKKIVNEDENSDENENQVRVDMTLDTLDTCVFTTLEYWTKDLVKALGNPMKSGYLNSEHLYEWKIQINKSIFSIYDWCNDQDFDDITWHVNCFGSYDKNEKNFDVLTAYIDELCIGEDIKLDFENLGDDTDEEEDDE